MHSPTFEQILQSFDTQQNSYTQNTLLISENLVKKGVRHTIVIMVFSILKAILLKVILTGICCTQKTCVSSDQCNCSTLLSKGSRLFPKGVCVLKKTCLMLHQKKLRVAEVFPERFVFQTRALFIGKTQNARGRFSTPLPGLQGLNTGWGGLLPWWWGGGADTLGGCEAASHMTGDCVAIALLVLSGTQNPGSAPSMREAVVLQFP